MKYNTNIRNSKNGGRNTRPYILEGIYAEIHSLPNLRLQAQEELTRIKNRIARWLSQIDKLVQENYLFLGTEKDRWNDMISSFNSIIDKKFSEENCKSYIKKGIRQMGDPHLQIHFGGGIKNYNSTLQWIDATLWILRNEASAGNEWERILAIAGRRLDDIIEWYSSELKCNIGEAQRYILEDIIYGDFEKKILRSWLKLRRVRKKSIEFLILKYHRYH